MIGGDPQLATPSPGASSNGNGSRAFSPRPASTTYLFGAAAVYCLFALAWSVAGREDLGNARAAALCAVVALAVTLATIIAHAGGGDDRGKLYGWISLAFGVAFLTAAEIAQFSVIWTDNVLNWHPNSMAWLQAAGALGVLIGVLFLLAGVSGDRARIAAACSFLAFGLAVALLFVFGGRLAFDGTPSSWSSLASLLGIAPSVVATVIACDAWRSRNDEADLSAAGLALFASFIGISITLQSFGGWSELSGLMSLGRWVIPVAALGAFAATIDHARHRNEMQRFGESDWTRWPIATGGWALIATICVAAASIVGLSMHAAIGADLAVIASFCACCSSFARLWSYRLNGLRLQLS